MLRAEKLAELVISIAKYVQCIGQCFLATSLLPYYPELERYLSRIVMHGCRETEVVNVAHEIWDSIIRMIVFL